MSEKQHELTLIGLVLLAAVAVFFVAPATAADTGIGGPTIVTGPAIFDEQFASTTLDPAWSYVELFDQRGRYSLTEHPGFFRFYGENHHTCEAQQWYPGWVEPHYPPWTNGDYLFRTFDGDHWALRTSATYNLHGWGGQTSIFRIAFGEGSGPQFTIGRHIDLGYGESMNHLSLDLINTAGGEPAYLPRHPDVNYVNYRAPDDVFDANRWVRHTYWSEIIRDGLEVTVRISTDGTNFVDAASFTLPPGTSGTQKMAISQLQFDSGGSYTDWDYISVNELAGSDPELTVDAGGPYVGTEGSPVTLSAAVPAGPAIASCDWDFNGDGTYDRTTATTSTSYTWTDDFVGILGVRVTDTNGHQASDTASVTIANADPVISSLNVPANVVPLGTSITATAIYEDAGTADTHTIFWDWTDGTDDVTTQPHAAVPGTIVETHTYAMAGVYPVVLYVTDDDDGSAVAIASAFVVVFDTEGGFVTGGGWFDSPAGAYLADPTVTGKGTFAFVSKYQKGASEPTGQTQFDLKAANFRFHSTDYDWLVVSGNRVQFQGSGRVNGQDGYGFVLTAVDDAPDLLRLKIWEKATDTVVYDNQPDDMDVAALITPIGGGSIVFHT